jgi:outer membrane protein OmpA-like peptidoglycan-associated protein
MTSRPNLPQIGSTISVMRLLPTSRAALLGAIVVTLAALTMTTAPAVANVLPAAVTPSVPILGQVALKNNYETGKSPGLGTLHGVRRIPGGTAIYFSVGYPSSTPDTSPFIPGLDHDSPAFSRAKAATWFAKNLLIDPAGQKVYSSLIRSESTRLSGRSDCICSDFNFGSYQSGQARVLYQVVAALPESVTFVDVFISGQVIGHVKVEIGPMTPEVDPNKAILAGMGWPKIDAAAVASSLEPAKSIIDLQTSVADLKGAVTTRTDPKQISVAVASDVLFATDSATLSPKAQVVLGRAAAEVKAAGAAGNVQIIGYTDNTGSTAHNVDLSRRRAASVAAAIKPMLAAGVRLSISGKGEADPVSPNTTDEGRTLNRRVSIVFAPKGGAK